MTARRRGVSPIVAELMILAIVVSLGAGVFLVASDSAAGLASGLGLRFGESANAAQEIYSVEYAQFTSTTSTFVPVTVVNSQASPTPAGFQEEVTFNPSTYASHEASDLGNIRFCADPGCSTYLNAWLEGCTPSCSPSATSATAWVALTASVSAGNPLTIYMVFLPPTTEFDGRYWGEAPQLSPSYGEFDNGGMVFAQYGGASWSSFTFVGGAWTTSSGFLQQTSTSGSYAGGPAALIEGASYPVTGSYVVETAFSYTGQADARVGIIADGTPSGGDTYGYRFIGQQLNNGAGFLSFLNDEVTWVVNNVYQGATSTPYAMSVTDAGGTWSGALYAGYGVTGTPLTTLAATSYTAANLQGATSGYLGISAGYYTGTAVIGNPISVQWFRVRDYPPGGVMPSASLGTLTTSVVGAATVTIRNAGYVETELASLSFFAVTPVGAGYPTSGVFTVTTTPPMSVVASTAHPYCSVAGGAIAIPVSSFCTVTVPFQWYPGATYNLVVSTLRGNNVEVQENA